MKTQKLLFLMAGAALAVITGCKKDDPDPRDAFVGSYEMEADCGQLGQGADELEIAKNNQDNNVLILNSEVLAGLGAEDVEAEISGSEFEISPVQLTFNNADTGETVTVRLTGNGQLRGNDLDLQLELDNTPLCDMEGQKQ